MLQRARKYFIKHRSTHMRWRYELAEPKPYTRYQYIVQVAKKLVTDSEAMAKLIEGFKKHYPQFDTGVAYTQVISSITAKRLVSKALHMRKHQAGALLKAVRSITKFVVTEKDDFGEGLHTAYSEPFFYESAYRFTDRPSIISIDNSGKCRHKDDNQSEGVPKSWKCSTKCKPLTKFEVNSILQLKQSFNGPIHEVRKSLDACDVCPNSRYTKVFLSEGESKVMCYSPVELTGHSLLCSLGSECNSQLRILKAASTHFPLLRSLLRCVYAAIRSHKCVADLDRALNSGNFDHLIKLVTLKPMKVSSVTR